MKKLSTREFLKSIGCGGAALATGAALGDEYIPDRSSLPEGSCGDPQNVWFGRHIFPLEQTMFDGPSCFVKDGKVVEPAHEIPVFHKTDVVVVGGGPAGFAAALSAARAGAKVALVERYGSLGGLFTNGMVLIVLATCARNDGKWNLVTRGVCEEFMRRADKLGRNFCSQPPICPGGHWQPTIDPEAAKVLMDEMIAEAKVEMFFHCWGVDVIQDGAAVGGVVFESKEGRQAILAKQVVDCSGDADMLFKAGGGYSQVTSPISTVFRWANMDTIAPPATSAGQAFPRHGNEGNPDARWGHAGMETGNALSVRDLSRLEVLARKKNWERVAEMRRTPGWEKVYTSNSASQIGVRQSRLVDAEYIMGRKEIFEENDRVDDCIGWCGVDGPHAAFKVAWRQLLPKKVDNLLCAGRCLGRGDSIDTFRLIAPCFVTGQAAGAGAALAALGARTPRSLDYSTIRKELTRQGVFLG